MKKAEDIYREGCKLENHKSTLLQHNLAVWTAKEFAKEQAMDFADWINRNSYEPMALFPLKDNKKWSCNDGETTRTTKQLFEEYCSQTAAGCSAKNNGA